MLIFVHIILFFLLFFQKAVLGKNGSVIRRICIEAKQDLMNTFRREMSLKIAVRKVKKSAKPDPFKKRKAQRTVP